MNKKKRTKTTLSTEVPLNHKIRKQHKRFSNLATISLVFIAIFIIAITIYKITDFIVTENLKNNSFPKLEISLKDVVIEQIDAGTKDVKYPDNTIAITIDGKAISYDGVEIKGRGNFTWTRPKKPYQIKFSDKTSLFGRESAKKWVLLADYGDYTHLRNDTVFKLADLLDQNYAHQGDYLELYIDDTYRGLYYIVKKIDLDKNSVNLKDEHGILVELDNSYGEANGCNYDSKENCIVEKGTVNKDYSTLAMKDFISSLNSFYKAISSKDYATIEKVINVDSFVNYYLLNEFSANPDAYSSSFYMYKDGKESKISAGPIWDFDMALGNKSWNSNMGINSDKIYSPFETMAFKNPSEFLNESSSQTYKISTILYDLMDIPEFEARVKEIYQETLSGHKEELLNYIRDQANYIRDAVLRDQARWKLQYDFDEEVDYLIDWVAKRYDHFEEVYGATSDAQTTSDPNESESEL